MRHHVKSEIHNQQCKVELAAGTAMQEVPIIQNLHYIVKQD